MNLMNLIPDMAEADRCHWYMRGVSDALKKDLCTLDLKTVAEFYPVAEKLENTRYWFAGNRTDNDRLRRIEQQVNTIS